MLQNMRDNLKGIGIIIVAIIAIPFALTGVDNFFLRGGGVTEIATVNGVTITETDIRREVSRQRQQYLSQYGEAIMQFLSDDMLRGQALNQLLNQQVVSQAATAEGMGVAEQSIQQTLRDTAAFQSAGKFDPQQYSFILGQLGYSPSSYTEQMRRDFLGGQFVQGVVASEFTTSAELEQTAAIAEQQRDFYYLTVPVAPLLASVEVTEEQLQARYEESKDQLVVPEQVVVEYLELTPDQLVAQQSVTDEQVQQRFASMLENASQNALQQKRLSHILLSAGDDAKLTEVQQKLTAGEDFSTLAKEYSTDAGTAVQGGDLGFIDPDALPEALTTAVSELAVGQVSEAITSESGIHLVKVTELQAAKLPTLEEQRERISDELKSELAAEQFILTLEQLKDAVYSAETLQQPADEFGLSVRVAEPFARTGGTGIAANKNVISAAFSDEVLNQGFASQVIELDAERAVVVKLKERIAERTKALDEVRDQLLADLRREAAETAVKARGEQLLARVRGGESVEQVAKAEQLEWQVSHNTKRTGGNVDATARATAFAMAAPAGGSLAEGASNSAGDYLVIELSSVEYPALAELPAAQRQALSHSIASTSGERGVRAYQNWLLAQADVEQRSGD